MRTVGPLLLAAGLALPGCPRPSPGSPPAGPPSSPRASDQAADTAEPPPPRYVLLWDGATLASGLDQTADTARAYDSRRDEPATGMYWIMRLRANYGDWLEVETLPPDDAPHCETALPGLDEFQLRLFVRARDAVTVTRREVEVTLPGGSRVTLGPGVRVTPPAAETQPATVHVDPQLRLMIPTDAIGQDYEPPVHYDRSDPVASLRAGSVPLTEDIMLPARLGGQVFARTDDGGATIVTLAERCVRYELRVPSSTVDEPQTYGWGGLGMRGTGHIRYRIAADAPVYWRNGERAGTTRHEVLRTDEPARREVGRVCFDHHLTWKPQTTDPALTLCVDAVDVRPEDAANDPGRSPAPGS